MTDGYISNVGKAVLPDKLLNALYWKYENEGTEFTISITELRELLSLKSIKDDARIIEAIKVLRTTIVLRDFSYQGREVAELISSFLLTARKWKDREKYFDFKLDDMFIEAMKQKAGYTPLELKVCNQFKTKYGLKLYEQFVRYYHLPNKKGKGVGTISKSFDDLNKKFSTNFTQPSKMLEGINRGLKEIKKITGEEVYVFYNKPLKSFVFSWEQKSKYPRLRIPFIRIDEMIGWYLEHNQDLKIKNVVSYRANLKQKILDDQFDNLDKLWSGLLHYKYGAETELDKDGKFKDIKLQPSRGLF